MKPPYNIEITGWDQFIKLTRDLRLWGFRGQEDSTWSLETSLHRVARYYNVNKQDLWHREYWMLRQFIRRAQHYVSGHQLNQSHLEWLALMQHYGAPTRLLDFSHSPFIAAFFALENATKDSAVWCLNIDLLRSDNAAQFDLDRMSSNIDQFNMSVCEIVNELISRENSTTEAQKQPLAIAVEPEKPHERLLSQQGFFLFPNDMLSEVQENISGEDVILATKENTNPLIWPFLGKGRLVKMVIPYKLRSEILESLESMNVTARTLFPGLDGFARSMKYHVSTYL